MPRGISPLMGTARSHIDRLCSVCNFDRNQLAQLLVCVVGVSSENMYTPLQSANKPLAGPLPTFSGLKATSKTAQYLQVPPVGPFVVRKVVPKTRVGRSASTSVVRKPTCMSAALNIVFIAAEVAPFSKTGGLGDVVGGLPVELAKRGHKVMTVAPRYDQYKETWDTSVVKEIQGKEVRFFHMVQKGVDRVFVDNPVFLAKVMGKTGSKLYGPRSGADYVDNEERFRLFCEAAIEAARCLPFSPGEDVVFVANDWHSALVPALIKYVYQPKGEFTDAKVVFCVHNIAFQGRFWREDFARLNLPEECAPLFEFQDGYSKIFTEADPADENEKTLEDPGKTYEKINWMKAGFLTADKILTVSPNYAEEVQLDEATGVELDGVIRSRGIEGIVNGMDTTEWNPATDKYLDVKYSEKTVVQGKAAAKEALQAELGLPLDPTIPLIGFIGRLEEQKGVDIMFKALPGIMKGGKVQVVVLGTGKKKYETVVKSIEKEYPSSAKGIVKFSAPLAHMITAGADFMLVPSRFEPCGLIQLHSMQYGTVPIVSSTGGLVDTVSEGVTGFQMGSFDLEELVEGDVESVVETVQRAVEVYSTPLYQTIVANCISQDLSWAKPALKWEGVLEELMSGSAAGTEKKSSVQTPVSEISVKTAS
eukprot:TRINITY_DN54_c8_g1_i3.p1 TRINITY_DN54_c8_g1~~TRINITY_DN54_c8_g1_i3.p1  ORF type:complete len:648 (+),score=104.64 TRINITY_DN54_c8_g1_i3:27-1970(+)